MKATPNSEDLPKSSDLRSKAGQSRLPRELGATVVEYSMIGVLVAVVCVLAVQYLGVQASQSFSKVGSGFVN